MITAYFDSTSIRGVPFEVPVKILLLLLRMALFLIARIIVVLKCTWQAQLYTTRFILPNLNAILYVARLGDAATMAFDFTVPIPLD